MKKCPQCAMTYDDATTFCLEDGTPLISASATNEYQAQPTQQAISSDPPPTVMWGGTANAPPPNFQPPFNQSPPNFQIPPTNPTVAKPTFSTGKIVVIASVVVVFIGLIGAVAGLAFYKSSDKKASVDITTDNSADKKSSTFDSEDKISADNSAKNNGVSINKSSSDKLADPVLFDTRNGFVRGGQPYDKTSSDYPGSSKIKAALYSKLTGSISKVIHGEAAVYASSDTANEGFEQHLKMLQDRNAVITQRDKVKDSTYAYYRMGEFYGFTLAVKNSVIDYSAMSMEDLQNFLKDDKSGSQKDDSPAKTISGGSLNGKATYLPSPVYPAAARSVRASGAVNVQVTVDTDGSVISAAAVSGHPLLRASAEQAARGAKFAPTMLNGQAVKVNGVIIYNFSLD